MTTEAEAIAKLAQRGPERLNVTVGNDERTFIMRPNDWGMPFEVVDREYRPDHVIQQVSVQDAPSLSGYVNRFGNTSTVLFANLTASQVVAAIDYHQSSGDKATASEKVLAEATAEHVHHRATLTLMLSPEFQAWAGINGKWLLQEDFARFLEENRDDVTLPAVADLIEIVNDLYAHRMSNWGKRIRNGSVESVEFKEETATGTKSGAMPIPGEIRLGIPVYMHGPSRNLRVFFRVEVLEGKLKVMVKIARLESERQQAFRDVANEIAVNTGSPVIFGAIGS